MEDKLRKLRMLLLQEITLYKQFPQAYWGTAGNCDEYIDDLMEIYDSEYKSESEIDIEIELSLNSIENAKRKISSIIL